MAGTDDIIIDPKRDRLVITASSLGTVFEWYDFFVYGILGALIGKRLGNPPGNRTIVGDAHDEPALACHQSCGHRGFLLFLEFEGLCHRVRRRASCGLFRNSAPLWCRP